MHKCAPKHTCHNLFIIKSIYYNHAALLTAAERVFGFDFGCTALWIDVWLHYWTHLNMSCQNDSSDTIQYSHRWYYCLPVIISIMHFFSIITHSSHHEDEYIMIEMQPVYYQYYSTACRVMMINDSGDQALLVFLFNIPHCKVQGGTENVIKWSSEKVSSTF